MTGRPSAITHFYGRADSGPHPKNVCKSWGMTRLPHLYGLPHFTPEEKRGGGGGGGEYFALSPRETAAIEQLHSIKSRIYAILQLGYFKARHLFFVFSFSAVVADIQYIQSRYFPECQLTEFEPTKVTRLKQQRIILELCNYRICSESERQALIRKAQQTARVLRKTHLHLPRAGAIPRSATHCYTWI